MQAAEDVHISLWGKVGVDMFEYWQRRWP